MYKYFTNVRIQNQGANTCIQPYFLPLLTAVYGFPCVFQHTIQIAQRQKHMLPILDFRHWALSFFLFRKCFSDI